MCGIVGWFDPEHTDKVGSRSRMEAMVAAISHRGPDASALHVEPGLFLGHARLAVLDLSSAGKQPMSSADGNLVISYNGEVYNFRELRRQLEHFGHGFHTGTDTEVILASWKEWGPDCLQRLDGIFAFALFDRNARSLYLVRDHFGVKPLFYHQTEGRTVFASEPLAMFGPGMSVPDLEPVDLDHYFTFNYLPAPLSGLRGVRQLPGGHFLELTVGGSRLQRYWQLPLGQRSTLGDGELLEAFQEKVRHAVRSQLVSDAPLGIFLSGGLDSGLVASLIRDSGQRPEAFSLGFQDARFDESALAAQCADTLELPFRRVGFTWGEAEILATLDAMRELMADASCFPMYQLAREARNRVTVVLSGDGGDELLAGYDTYKAGALMPWLRGIPKGVRDAILFLAGHFSADSGRYSHRLVAERLLASAAAGPGYDHASFRRIFFDPLKERLYEPSFLRQVRDLNPLKTYVQRIDDALAMHCSSLTARQAADMDHFLPSVLAKVDRMSMAHGLEVRVPLLNRDLVEFCFQLPDRAKRRGGKGKYLSRQMVAHHLPQEYLTKPKAGFLPPVDSWFRHPGPMFDIFHDHVHWALHQPLGWLRWSEVIHAWADHRTGRINIGFALLGILQFINWHKHLSRIASAPGGGVGIHD
ncbi:MAG: asparagine synthase (glutamine-hydrolyzing) [Magnetococcales bacterium]|nr:asparagine synthase (glutamine-hydrolyzing) [Magnetococcales bacterium]